MPSFYVCGVSHTFVFVYGCRADGNHFDTIPVRWRHDMPAKIITEHDDPRILYDDFQCEECEERGTVLVILWPGTTREYHAYVCPACVDKTAAEDPGDDS